MFLKWYRLIIKIIQVWYNLKEIKYNNNVKAEFNKGKHYKECTKRGYREKVKCAIKNGVYEIKFNCNATYVNQAGRKLKTEFR